MRNVWHALLNLFYPPVCCACGQPTGEPEFCPGCRARIATPHSPLCTVCGTPFETAGDSDHACGRCLQHPPRFAQARAAAIYDAADSVSHPLKTVLQRYKYQRDVSLAPALAQLLADRCPVSPADYDVIMPVPLHLSRLRWRGFNQAQFLAAQLARRARVPIDALSLLRTRPTRPQVQLSEAERRRNVARAFRVGAPQRVHNRKILLVDDVYTTGATVDECARVLLRAGAQRVDVLVLARAVLR